MFALNRGVLAYHCLVLFFILSCEHPMIATGGVTPHLSIPASASFDKSTTSRKNLRILTTRKSGDDAHDDPAPSIAPKMMGTSDEPSPVPSQSTTAVTATRIRSPSPTKSSSARGAQSESPSIVPTYFLEDPSKKQLDGVSKSGALSSAEKKSSLEASSSFEASVMSSGMPTSSPNNNNNNNNKVGGASKSGAPSSAEKKPPLAEGSVSPSETPTSSPKKKKKVGGPSESGAPSSAEKKLPLAEASVSSSEMPTSSPKKKPSSAASQSISMPISSPSTSDKQLGSVLETEAPSLAKKRPAAAAPPSSSPIVSSSAIPTTTPSKTLSTSPTSYPSNATTGTPSASPSGSPSVASSELPSAAPSSIPSSAPSGTPSASSSSSPSVPPSAAPSLEPSSSPSNMPSLQPSDSPSEFPSSVPSTSPSDFPSPTPSAIPSTQPSFEPSAVPSDAPSTVPSVSLSEFPSSMPSTLPSDYPSPTPSVLPSIQPSFEPSAVPSDAPSSNPSDAPTLVPSSSPSQLPSASPSTSPSDNPSTAPSSVPSFTLSDESTAEPSSAPSSSPLLSTSTEQSDFPSMSPTIASDDDNFRSIDTVTLQSTQVEPMDENTVVIFEDVCGKEFLPAYLPKTHLAEYTDTQCKVLSQTTMEDEVGGRVLQQDELQEANVEIRAGTVAILMEALSQVEPAPEDFEGIVTQTLENYSTEFQEMLSVRTSYFPPSLPVPAAALSIDDDEDGRFPTLIVIGAVIGGALAALLVFFAINRNRIRDHQEILEDEEETEDPIFTFNCSPTSAVAGMAFAPSKSVSSVSGPQSPSQPSEKRKVPLEIAPATSPVASGNDELSPSSWCDEVEYEYRISGVDTNTQEMRPDSVGLDFTGLSQNERKINEKNSSICMSRVPTNFSTGVCSVESEMFNRSVKNEATPSEEVSSRVPTDLSTGVCSVESEMFNRSVKDKTTPSEEDSSDLQGLKIVGTSLESNSTGGKRFYGWPKRLLGFKSGKDQNDIPKNVSSPGVAPSLSVPSPSSHEARALSSMSSEDSSVDLVMTSLISLRSDINGPVSPNSGDFAQASEGKNRYPVKGSPCPSGVSSNADLVLSDLGELEHERSLLKKRPTGTARTPKAGNRGKLHKAPGKALYGKYGS